MPPEVTFYSGMLLILIVNFVHALYLTMYNCIMSCSQVSFCFKTIEMFVCNHICDDVNNIFSVIKKEVDLVNL